MTHPVVRYLELKSRRVVGLMSGTSADGIDAALVEIGSGGVRLVNFITVPLEDAVRGVLFRLFEGRGTPRTVARMHVLMGELFADAARQAGEADLIASHGQTIYHQPVASRFAGHRVRCTFQIGDGCVIAARTGCPVISDFRAADVAWGGQGAPLVPYADRVLFTDAKLWRVALNIGGIANITWLPPRRSKAQPIAFDTGPGNALMDATMRLLAGQPCDRDGALAGRGRIDQKALQSLLAHPYFKLQGPRSTGREMFGEPMARGFIAQFPDLSVEDRLATLASFTARTIAQSIRTLPRTDEVLAAGGGVHNRTLMRMLKKELNGIALRRSDQLGYPADAREAIAFAILGDATMRGLPSNVPEATGAPCPLILGKLSLPPA
ncbi:MAG: anhydro-N-acetylmuramic acid kinase [Candidatus Xenobia bacterium]